MKLCERSIHLQASCCEMLDHTRHLRWYCTQAKIDLARETAETGWFIQNYTCITLNSMLTYMILQVVQEHATSPSIHLLVLFCD